MSVTQISGPFPLLIILQQHKLILLAMNVHHLVDVTAQRGDVMLNMMTS